jgi:hypothetical protein
LNGDNGDTDCGQGVFAGPNTSCPFALNVRQQYLAAQGDSVVIDVYSPVTQQTYTMNCVRTAHHVPGRKQRGGHVPIPCLTLFGRVAPGNRTSGNPFAVIITGAPLFSRGRIVGNLLYFRFS